MNVINIVVTALFTILYYPFDLLVPVYGLVSFSILCGIIMLLIFKKTSNQEGIRKAKNKIKAHMFEMRLYNDNPILSFKAAGDIFKYNFIYLSHMLKPLIFLMIPMMFFLIQMSSRYQYRPFVKGERSIISVELASEDDIKDVALKASESIIIETPPFRIVDQNMIFWRIRVLEDGIWQLKFQNKEDSISKMVAVGQNSQKKLSPYSLRKNRIQSLLYPAEDHLPVNSFLRYIKVDYPGRRMSVFGLQVHWLILFIVISMAGGFALKGLFGVEL